MAAASLARALVVASGPVAASTAPRYRDRLEPAGGRRLQRAGLPGRPDQVGGDRERAAEQRVEAAVVHRLIALACAAATSRITSVVRKKAKTA